MHDLGKHYPQTLKTPLNLEAANIFTTQAAALTQDKIFNGDVNKLVFPKNFRKQERTII